MPEKNKRLKYSEYQQIEQALLAVEESEADFGSPRKTIPFLYETLRGISGVHTNKETMKRVAREVTDHGCNPD